MDVTLSSRQSGDVNILDLGGAITLGQGSNRLRNALNDLIGRNQKKLLLNMAGLSFIDSSGIRELLAAFQKLSENGGQLKLLNPTRRVRDLLTITKLNTVFEIYEDEAAAVSSFAAAPPQPAG